MDKQTGAQHQPEPILVVPCVSVHSEAATDSCSIFTKQIWTHSADSAMAMLENHQQQSGRTRAAGFDVWV